MSGELRLQGVRLAIGGRMLIGPLSATVQPGECLTLMGPSGCGKSSLLAIMAGTLDPAFEAQGRVAVGDTELTPLPPEARRVGILFQDDLLFPHLSVAGNLAFALPAYVRPMAKRRACIEMALADAGLAGFGERDPATLSGGQRARVALLRTLLAEPRALLLDEPFSKLDAQLRDEVRRFVFGHARRSALPTVLVTHDEADAAAAGGAVIRLGLPG
jgi:putative thiamine transport system ATP-binding protein